MRWSNVWGCALSLMGLLGCPRAFGPGGTIDRGLKKDQAALQEFAKPKPKGECPPDAELEVLCEYPEDDFCPRECLE